MISKGIAVKSKKFKLKTCYHLCCGGGRFEVGTAKKALGRVQDLACNCISSAMRTCLAGAIEILLELTPLKGDVERVPKEVLVRIEGEQVGGGKHAKSNLVRGYRCQQVAILSDTDN